MVWLLRSRPFPVSACVVAGLALAVSFYNSAAQARSAAQDAGVQRAIARANGFAEAGRLGLNYLPGEVIVRFKAGTTAARKQRALMALRSRPDVSVLEPHADFDLLRDPSQPDSRILAQQLREQPEVEYAEPNYILKTSPLPRAHRSNGARRPAPTRGLWGAALRVPNDPDYADYQWNLSMLRMPSAWEIQDGATADVIVAVLDTGVTTVNQTYVFPLWTGSSFQQVAMPVLVNPDLPASRHVSPRDYVFPQTGAVVDFDGHGTHVSATVAEEAFNNSLVAGIAYRARIMPVKVCTTYWEVMIARAQAGIPGFVSSDAGGCAFSDVASGLRYAADNGARVINISLAGDGAFTPMRDAIQYAISRGAFVAMAMGNEFDEGNPVMYPAAYGREMEGAMAVGAIAKNETRAFYSNTGNHVEIAAPGGDFTGVRPDLGLIWQSTLDFSFNDPSTVVRPSFDVYDIIGYQGTSMAAPHVAGLAALIIAQSPNVSPGNVERIISATAKDLGTRGKDDDFGNGLIQPRAALFGRGIAK